MNQIEIETTLVKEKFIYPMHDMDDLLFMEDKINIFFVYLNPLSVKKILQFIEVVTKKKEASEFKNAQLQSSLNSFFPSWK